MSRALFQQSESVALIGASLLARVKQDVQQQRAEPGASLSAEPPAAGIDKAFAGKDRFFCLCSAPQGHNRISSRSAPGRTEDTLHNRPTVMLQ